MQIPTCEFLLKTVNPCSFRLTNSTDLLTTDTHAATPSFFSAAPLQHRCLQKTADPAVLVCSRTPGTTLQNLLHNFCKQCFRAPPLRYRGCSYPPTAQLPYDRSAAASLSQNTAGPAEACSRLQIRSAAESLKT